MKRQADALFKAARPDMARDDVPYVLRRLSDKGWYLVDERTIRDAHDINPPVHPEDRAINREIARDVIAAVADDFAKGKTRCRRGHVVVRDGTSHPIRCHECHKKTGGGI